MKIVKFGLIFLICVIVAAFAAHNADYVPLNFYPFGIKISIAAFFLIFICLLLGVIIAGIVASTRYIYYRRIIKNKDKRIDALEKELVEKTINPSLPRL